eukprot:m.17536 g.17536  ORF g.17536 m.17536 type:complete len:680 (-) comp7491_c0_seq2:261-2300(-)
MEGEESGESLHEQVLRLNHLLSKYQRKFGVLSDVETRGDLDESGSDFLIGDALSPLLAELEGKARMHEEQVRQLKGELSHLANDSRKVVEENEALHEALSAALADKSSDTTAGFKQLQQALAEVDSLTQHNQKLRDELKAARDDSESKLRESIHLSKQLQTRSQQLAQVRQQVQEVSQLASAADDIARDMEQLREENRHLRQEIQQMQVFHQHQTTAPLSHTQSEDHARAAIHPDDSASNPLLTSTPAQQPRELPRVSESAQHSPISSHSPRSAIIAQEAAITELKSKNAQLQLQLDSIQDKLSSSSFLGETAVESVQNILLTLERQSVQLESARQRQADSDEMAEALRKDVERQAAREQTYQAEVDTLESELRLQQDRVADLEHRLKISKRQCEDTEAKMGEVMRAPAAEISRLQSQYNSLSRSLAEAQSSRNQALLGEETAQRKLDASQAELRHLKQDHLVMSEMYEERLAAATKKNEAMRLKISELSALLVDSSKAAESSAQLLSKAKMQHKLELEELQSTLDATKKRYGSRLEAAEVARRKLQAEVAQSMTRHSEHTKALSDQSKATNDALQAKVLALNSAISSLTSELQTLKRAQAQADSELSLAQGIIDEDVIHIQQLSACIAQLEQRLAQANARLASSAETERELSLQVQDLQIELTRHGRASSLLKPFLET